MLSKLLSFFAQTFKTQTEQEKLDAFIAYQQPASVNDVEYWIGVYDRMQYQNRSKNFGCQ